MTDKDDLLDHLQEAIARGESHAALALKVQNIRATRTHAETSAAVPIQLERAAQRFGHVVFSHGHRVRVRIAPDAKDADTPVLVKCEDCNRPYGNEFGFPDLVVPHEAWESIMPGRGGGGMLCPSCMCKRAHDVGIECKASFRSGPFFESDAFRRTETSAAVAAALEEAALECWYKEDHDRMLALITPDATVALERDRARVRREALEEAAKIAEDHTPDKHSAALASHVTGSSIIAAIRALGDKP